MKSVYIKYNNNKYMIIQRWHSVDMFKKIYRLYMRLLRYCCDIFVLVVGSGTWPEFDVILRNIVYV